MKQQILADINSKLLKLRIQAEYIKGADVVITAEFLDAGWSTGSKKINYESSIFIDERAQTVFMYEKTTETGHGFSFGSQSSSTFQSGATLFRKVKSVQYGPDGKAYEYTLDLGAIPKAVKETAKQYGWKFKTVLKKDKAVYPAGYIPTIVPPAASQPQQMQASGYCSNCSVQLEEGASFCSKCGKPVVAIPPVEEQGDKQSENSQRAFYSQSKAKNPKNKGGTLGLIMLFLLGLIAFGLFVLMKTSFTGWILGLIVFVFTIFLIKRFGSKGCITSAIILIIAALILFVIMVFTTDTTDNKKENNNQDNFNITSNKKSENYFDTGYSTYALPSGKYAGTEDGNTYLLNVLFNVIQNILVSDSNEPDKKAGSKVKEIRITNFKVFKQPKKGKVTGITFQGNSLNVPEKLQNGDLVYNMEEYSKTIDGWSSSFMFGFSLEDLGKYKFPENYNKGMNGETAIKLSGMSSNDIQISFSYDIIITTLSGEKYIRTNKIEFAGDYINDESKRQIDTSTYTMTEYKPFIKK